MNQISTNKIIEKLNKEICPKHNKSARFKGKNGVFIISDHCCSEFYNFLAQRITEELNNQSLNI
jgi:hypothetical protein